MVGGAEYFIENTNKSMPFHVLSFDSAAKSTIVELWKVYTKVSTDVYSFFLYFISEKVQGHAVSPSTVKQIFFNNMCLFEYKARYKNWRGEGDKKRARNDLYCWFEKSFSPRLLIPCHLLSFLMRTFSKWT